MTRRVRSPLGLRTISLILLAASALYFLLPLWWLLVSATKSQGDLALDPGLLFTRWSLGDNLATLFGRDGGIFLRWTLNSVLYSGVGALGATLISLMAGYAFSKHASRLTERLFSIVLVGVLLPSAILTLPLFLLASSVHATNSIASVLVPSLITPFGVYLGRVYADASVPDELLEAARVDGLSEIRIFFSVALPLMGPGAATLFLFQFIGIWNNFILPLMMLHDEELYPVTLGLVVWNSQYLQDPTLTQSVLVGSCLLVLPILVCFLLLQRQLRRGIAAGGLKG